MEEEKESANIQQDLFFGLYQINFSNPFPLIPSICKDMNSDSQFHSNGPLSKQLLLFDPGSALKWDEDLGWRPQNVQQSVNDTS